MNRERGAPKGESHDYSSCHGGVVEGSFCVLTADACAHVRQISLASQVLLLNPKTLNRQGLPSPNSKAQNSQFTGGY